MKNFELPEKFEIGDIVVTTDEHYSSSFFRMWLDDAVGQYGVVTAIDQGKEFLTFKYITSDKYIDVNNAFFCFKLVKKGPGFVNNYIKLICL